MKTIIHLSLLCCLFAFSRTQSVGMGYPQDMFADHMTAKKAAPAAKVGSVKKEKRKGIKNACELLAQAPVASPCKQAPTQPARPKKKIGQEAKSAPLVYPVQQLDVIVLKVFHVEEQVIPTEEWDNQRQSSHSFKKFIQTMGQTLFTYLQS
jgi:hypothetical protein